MLDVDELDKARKNRQHAQETKFFRRRWQSTAFYSVFFVLCFKTFLHDRLSWRSLVPWPGFGSLFHDINVTMDALAGCVFAIVLFSIWYQVVKYRHDEQKQAQEKALADAGKQTEGFWPPAPTKPM